jgi:alpha-L-rhamnosidase
MVLGVYPTADGYKSVRIKPIVDCYELDWAKGTVPTPQGVISVAWEKHDGELTLDIALPEGADMACEVILPDGQVLTQNETAKRYTCRL